MIAYVIGILPLIKNFKRDLPEATQPCYSDIAEALSTFAIIETYFNFITRQCSGREYYPKTSKSVLIVHPDHLKAGKVFGARHRFKVCMGACYLGDYIGDNEYKCNWLRERTLI